MSKQTMLSVVGSLVVALGVACGTDLDESMWSTSGGPGYGSSAGSSGAGPTSGTVHVPNETVEATPLDSGVTTTTGGTTCLSAGGVCTNGGVCCGSICCTFNEICCNNQCVMPGINQPDCSAP